jgi:hypothetical protein
VNIEPSPFTGFSVHHFFLSIFSQFSLFLGQKKKGHEKESKSLLAKNKSQLTNTKVSQNKSQLTNTKVR